jgi:hypothetical protein
MAKKPSTAVKAIFVQAGGVVGVPSGVGLALVAVWACNIETSTWPVIITGALIGLIGGIILAVLFNLGWEKLLAVLINRFTKTPGPTSTTVAGS